MAAEPRPPLLGRKKLVGATEEGTSGTFGTVTSALGANIYDVKCEPGDFFAGNEREPAGNYVGRVASVVGKQMGTLSYTMDVAPGGPFLSLLTGAGYLSTDGTYAPMSDLSSRKTWSLKCWEDGRCKKLAGAVCKVTINMEDGKKLTAKFEWTGVWLTPIDEAMPAQAPITAAPYVCKGITLTVASAAIAHVSKISVDLGSEPEERESLAAAAGIAHYLIGEIIPKITMDPEARKVADQDAYGAYLAGGTAALSSALASGSNTLTIAAPAVQRTKVSDGARGKRLTDELELQCCNSSGDDALTLLEE
jgi:hypothetical protein